MIEVEEPKTEEERIMFSCLGMAKHFHEDREEHPRGAEPTAFIFGHDQRLVIAPLGQLGDFASGKVRDIAAEMIRHVAKVERAHAVGFVSDCWLTAFPDVQTVEAEGLVCEQWRTWSDEQRARHLRRREALLLVFETRGCTKHLSQFYRRDRDRIVWEELVVRELQEGDEHSGRFADLLPRED